MIIKKFVDRNVNSIEVKEGENNSILITATIDNDKIHVMIEEDDIAEFIHELEWIKKRIDNND